ncbi:MAG: hypothetical protein PHR16_03430 [Methylovulum sp.]|nr:hypothetical protein [Methylovulum sp.]
MKKLLKVWLVLVFTLLVSAAGTPVIACGPYFPQPIFTFSIRPENFADFAAGKIGIIQPTWHRSALLAAYRELNGLPFSADEQKDLVRNWQAEYELADANEAAKTAAIDNWLAVRKKVLADEPEPTIYALRNAGNGYDYFLNCTAGAFENAVKTLAARIAAYTVNAEVKDWAHGQDQVFANCSQAQAAPAEASADAPLWLKHDRAYQSAAADFYAMRYDEAKRRFTEIAGDSASEWRQLAAYLLARVAVRQASLFAGEDAGQSQALYAQAIAQINAVLENGQLSGYHPAALQLLNFVNFRLHPGQLHDALAKKLLAKEENSHFLQDVTDYRRLLDKAELGNYEASAETKALQDEFRQNSPLTDWIFTVQATGTDGFAHAYGRWLATKDPVWLVASLVKATGNAPETAALQQQAKTIKSASAAFLTVNYHLVRLLMAQGHADEARKVLDAVLAAAPAALNKSATSQLYSQRMLLAQNIDEFVKYAQRRAVVFSENGSNYELIDLVKPAEGEDYYGNEREWLQRTMFDTDATRTLNLRMPLGLLKEMALHQGLPDYLKRRLVMSVWTRAVLLDDEKTALEFVPHVARYLPELKPFITQYGKANKQDRRFEAAWLMLKNPAMRPLVEQGEGRTAIFTEIDHWRDNWWCDEDFGGQFFDDQGEQMADFPAPAFLTQAEITQAATENAKIAALQGGSNYLARQAVQWAKFKPDEKRLPEALYLAVKATRYGCQNCATGKASKAAFEALNRRFKKSEWKKKTPYWFGDACAKP